MILCFSYTQNHVSDQWKTVKLFYCFMSGQAETVLIKQCYPGGFCKEQSQVPASKNCRGTSPDLVSHKETGWFRWFLRFLKNSYLMRDRKTFLMSSATEEQAVSAVCISHIPSDSHSQVRSHIPSSMTKPIGFVSSIDITFVNKVLPWCSIKVNHQGKTAYLLNNTHLPS